MEKIAPHPPRRSVRIAAWLIFLLLTCLLAEGIARAIFPVPEIRNFDRARYSPQMVSGPLLAQPTLAHASYIVQSSPDDRASLHKLNLYGFRDRTWPVKRTAARRVLVIGDSMVEGFLAEENQTIPHVLENLARKANEDVEILNFGVGGSGLVHYIPLAQDAVRIFKPDEIVFVLHANDLLGSPTFTQDLVKPTTDAKATGFWRPRTVDVMARIARGQAVPRRWHSKPFSFFPAVPDPANPWTQQGEAHAKFVTPELAKAMRAGRFNPFNVGEVEGYEHYLRQPVDIRPWFEFLKQFLDRQGIAFSVTYVPQPSQTTDHYRQFKQSYCLPGAPSLTGAIYQQGAATAAFHAASLGIPFLDLTPAIRDRESRGERNYWNYDEHMRPEGYAFAAEAIQQMRLKLHASKEPK